MRSLSLLNDGDSAEEEEEKEAFDSDASPGSLDTEEVRRRRLDRFGGNAKPDARVAGRTKVVGNRELESSLEVDSPDPTAIAG